MDYFNNDKINMEVGGNKLIEITVISKRNTSEFVYSRCGTKKADNSLHRKLSRVI